MLINYFNTLFLSPLITRLLHNLCLLFQWLRPLKHLLCDLMRSRWWQSPFTPLSPAWSDGCSWSWLRATQGMSWTWGSLSSPSCSSSMWGEEGTRGGSGDRRGPRGHSGPATDAQAAHQPLQGGWPWLRNYSAGWLQLPGSHPSVWEEGANVGEPKFRVTEVWGER